MKKNRIKIILLAAIFISANVATFLFAHGKIRIVEKVVTVYEESGGKNASSSVNADKAKSKSASAKSEVSKTAVINFNDSDYFVDNKNLKAAAPIENKEVDMIKEAVKPIESDKKVTATLTPSDDLKPYNSNINIADPNKSVKMADESIPVPQLPLFDTDFESESDTGGNANIPLPQLPDMSEVISDDSYEG